MLLQSYDIAKWADGHGERPGAEQLFPPGLEADITRWAGLGTTAAGWVGWMLDRVKWCWGGPIGNIEARGAQAGGRGAKAVRVTRLAATSSLSMAAATAHAFLQTNGKYRP